MDARRCDTGVKAVGSGASRRRVLGGLLGVLAGVAGLGGSEVQAAQRDICHRSKDGNWHLITVSDNAVQAHLAHGDFFGPDCGE